MMDYLPGSETISTAALGLEVVFKLGIVVLLIYASLYLLKRLQAGTATGKRKQLAVLETARLSPRQALHLVQVGDQVLLIGATDQSLNCLLEVEGVVQGIFDAGIEKVEGLQVEEPAPGLHHESKPFGPVASVPSNFAAFLMNAFGKR
jgi:flagellar biosynthetic protein FliO